LKFQVARRIAMFGIDGNSLPRGMLVGTVEIVGCRQLDECDSPAAWYVGRTHVAVGGKRPQATVRAVIRGGGG
jgi:hypothetical protein